MKSFGLLLLSSAALFAGSDVTFYRDVLPILEARCQGCHRPGEVGPMALGGYDETRPWAKAIKQAVLLGKMPPWYADAPPGKFHNDPFAGESGGGEGKKEGRRLNHRPAGRDL